MPSERWIFGFRYTETRRLSERELDQARGLASRFSSYRYLRGALAVFLGIDFFFGIALLAGEKHWWAWFVLIGSFVGFFWALSWASAAESTSLLYRRLVRVGEIDEYVRTGRDDRVRRAYRRSHQLMEDSEDEDYVLEPFWKAEEKFEERLLKRVGSAPAIIWTPAGDDVLVRADDAWVSAVYDVPVITLGDGRTA